MTFFLGGLGPWKEIREKSAVSIDLVSGQSGRHVLGYSYTRRLFAFAVFYQAVHDGACLSTADRIHVDPVLPVNKLYSEIVLRLTQNSG